MRDGAERLSVEEYRKLRKPGRVRSARKPKNADKSELFIDALRLAKWRVLEGRETPGWWVTLPIRPVSDAPGWWLAPQAHFRYDERRNPCRLDFALSERMIAIEVDGHAGAGRGFGSESEYRKRAEAMTAGWAVLSFTTTQCRRDPLWVADVFRRVLGRG